LYFCRTGPLLGPFYRLQSISIYSQCLNDILLFMLYNTYVHTVPEMLYGCRQYVSEAMSVGISKNILCHQSKSYLNNVTFSPLVTELDLHLKTDTAVIYADCKLINLMFF